MKTVTLTYSQSLKIEAILAAQTGNAGELRQVLKIMDKVALSEEGKKVVNLRSLPGGIIQWGAEGEVKTIQADLEDALAARLKVVLEQWPNFNPVDLAWLDKVLEQL